MSIAAPPAQAGGERGCLAHAWPASPAIPDYQFGNPTEWGLDRPDLGIRHTVSDRRDPYDTRAR
jgi:hypothetical protein